MSPTPCSSASTRRSLALTPPLALALAMMALAGLATAQLPEIPALDRDVYLIDDGVAKYPHVPPLRTSHDGRVGLDFKNKRLFLLAPEKLNAPLLESPPGVSILSDPSGITLFENLLHTLPTANVSLRHAALCDNGYASTSCAGGRCPNPRACGADDCYDLTIVTPVRRDDLIPVTIELWSTEFTVQVASPKTAAATMTLASTQTPQPGPSHPMQTIFETMITDDGHLMVGRVSTQHSGLPGIDIVYAVGPDTATPCDVSQWTQFHSVTDAHTDPLMNGRYGFAAYPLRDSTGALIPAGQDLRGTYPWIDRQGKNLFFTSIYSTYWYRTATNQPFQARFPASCVGTTACVPDNQLNFNGVTDPSSAQSHDENSKTRGTTVAGLWTHGKAVLLDGLINNIDFGMKIPSTKQRMAQLFEPNTDAQGSGDGKVRIGTGRHNGGGAGVYPPGFVNNSTFIDSLEHLFNANEDLVPLRLRDVVWLMTTGHHTDEIAFDDWVNPNAFIVSEMVGALEWVGGPSARFNYFDGFEHTSIGQWTGQGFSGVQPVRVQNSATAVSTDWVIPAYGEVFGGARLEPAALGGIYGKGLWLDGQAGIRYDIPGQPQDPDAKHWFAGLFLEPRFADDSTRRLILQFPDDSRFELAGLDTLHFVDPSGTDLATYTLTNSQKLKSHTWTHLGLLVDPGGTRVRLYLNGDKIKTWNAGAGQQLFSMVPSGASGALFAGKVESGSGAGFRGWIDELKVLAELPNAEVVCNHARGTLVEKPLIQQAPHTPHTPHIPQTPQTPLPVASHPVTDGPAGGQQLIFQAARAKRFCYTDYASQPGAHLKNLPAGTTSVRSKLLFPEGPLVWNQPRPDSTTNGFCLSCHVDSHITPSLQVPALALHPGTVMWRDPRRQPLQPPGLISGHIPMSFYSPNVPAQDIITLPQGEIQDKYVFPD